MTTVPWPTSQGTVAVVPDAHHGGRVVMIRMTARDSVTRERALTRAAVAWLNGQPHTAWEIINQAGLRELWPEFQRTALRRARRHFLARMS